MKIITHLLWKIFGFLSPLNVSMTSPIAAANLRGIHDVYKALPLS